MLAPVPCSCTGVDVYKSKLTCIWNSLLLKREGRNQGLCMVTRRSSPLIPTSALFILLSKEDSDFEYEKDPLADQSPKLALKLAAVLNCLELDD